MPLYEFQCGACNSAFEELVFSSATVEGVVCPRCGSREVRRKVSTFASKSGSQKTASSAGSCGPRGGG